MTETNDIASLREYLDRNSETAFAELVQRHVNLVYSVALRLTGNSHDAQDVTQATFVILAKKAASLCHRTNLAGWLYETARFTSRQLLRTRTRQQTREQEAYMQSTLKDLETESVWRQLSPLLEEAMSRLSEKERTLVALRFFENKSGAETAALAGINEWAARKRIERAMDKLQKFFSKRGIDSTTAAISGAISANSVQAAPIVLAKTATAVALAKGATVPLSTSTLIKGALKLIAWSKMKTAVIATVAVMLTAGTTTLVVIHASRVAANDAEVTALVHHLKMEDLRPEDCTPEFWQQLQQQRQSEKPDLAKVAAAVGPLVDVTLIERTNDHGRPSYLYRLKYQNLNENVLFRIIFDGKKIAYAEGYPEPK